MESFLESVQEAATQLTSSIPVLESGAWKQVLNENGLLSHLSKSGNTRSQFIVPESLSKLHAFLKDFTTVSTWDPSFVDHEFVMPISPDTHIDRRAFKFSGAYPYDFVYFVKEIVEQDASVILLGQSIAPPGMPATTPGYGRGELVNYTFILRKVDENNTKLTVVYGVNDVELPDEVGEALQDEDLRVAKRIAEAVKTWTPYNGAEVLKQKVLALEKASESWEVLYDEDGVRGVRSPDCNSVISQGDVPASVSEVLEFLQNSARAKDWVLFFHSHAVLRTIDAQTKEHHRLIKTPDGKTFEFVFYTKVFNLEDGSVALIGKSIDSPAAKPNPSAFRGEFLNHSFVLRKLTDSTTRLTVLYHIDPKVLLPQDLLRAIQTEDSKTVARIKHRLALGEVNEVDMEMDAGRNEVLEAVKSSPQWERLVGNVSVLCYRSPDCKTVSCVCEIPSDVESISAYLTDKGTLPRWISGLRDQRTVAYLDPRTSLHHRLEQVPNLPEIEVVFAMRQYREEDGSVVVVSRTIPNLPEAPQAKPGNVAIEFRNFSFHLQAVSDTKTKVTFVVNVKHPFQLPDEVLKDIQSKDSWTLANLRESFLAWERVDRLSQPLDEAMREMINAWENHRYWEKLSEEGTVQGYRSLDCKTVVSVGTVAGELPAVRAFLSDGSQFPLWVNGLKEQRLLSALDEATALNQRLLSLPGLPEIEVAFVTRQYARSNGDILLVSKSIPSLPGAPVPKEGNVAVEYRNFSFLLRKVDEDNTTVMLVINIKHPFDLPQEALKGIQTGESMYVRIINEKFAAWAKTELSSALEAGRSELQSAWQSHGTWEKLAESGSLHGYRSSDCKTVVSIGDVLGNIHAVKRFLLDGEQLAKWIAGLKRQRLVKYFDTKTTLNHRLLEVPNLPGIEVSFVTREFTEADGSVLLVSRTVPKLADAPKAKEGNVSVEYLNYSFYLQKVEECKTKVMLAINIKHSFELPPEALKQIQTGESMYVGLISEKFAYWDKADHLTAPLSSARTAVLSAVQSHSSWESLAVDGTTHGYRSTDCKSVFSTGEVTGPLAAVKAFLRDGKQVWVAGVKEQHTISFLDADTALHHRTLQLPNLPEIEVAFATREYREEDGSVLLVSKSVPGLPDVPKVKEGNASIEYINFSFHLQAIDSSKTQVSLLINIKHPFDLPAEAIKSIQTNESLYVKLIAEKFSAWEKVDPLSACVDGGRNEVLAALQEHEKWEKLAVGAIHGFRSPDYKTVISIGEVPGSLLAVKTFLQCPQQLSRWIFGLREQRVLQRVDDHTTVNHRFLQLPGLPGIEVVFATREYTEDDKSVVIVSRSVEGLQGAPGAKEGNVMIEYLNFSFHLSKAAEDLTQVVVVINIKHPFHLPAEALRDIQTGESMYVSAIVEKFASWLADDITPALSYAKSQVSDALEHFSEWEKLAEDGTVRGYRTADTKTVLSIGELHCNFNALKSFLSDPALFPTWIAGLKEQKVLRTLDAWTKLHHRLLQLPNLPEIEVVFATREYREKVGAVALVSTSLPHCTQKPKQGNVGIEYVNFSFHLKKLSDTTTQLAVVLNIKHPFDLPAEVLKQIQTGESMYVKVIGEKFASWQDSAISPALDAALADLRTAWNSHESWESLAESGVVQGYRSSDCKTVVSVGEVNGDLPTLTAFLSDGVELQKWVAGVKSQRVIAHLDAKTIVSHRHLELPNLPGIEVVFATREYEEEDGSVAIVSRSVPEVTGGLRPRPGRVGIEYLNFSFYLQQVSSSKTKVLLALNINHPFQLPPEALKTVQSSESLYVKHIRERFATYRLTHALDAGKAEVLHAWQNFSTWEKLAADGATQGYRSLDCKTVVSIGEVHCSLAALKTFLTDSTQLPRWISGLKEHIVLGHLDARTTLNQRFLVVPNLPEIEVVFVTREFQEEDGSVLLVSKTVPNLPGAPAPRSGNASVEYNNFSFCLKKLGSYVTQVMLIININHPFQLPEEVLKQIQTGESMYVNLIAEKFASWENTDISPVLDAGHAEVIAAWAGHSSWEKLAEVGHTHGYRSADHKTVVSIGEIHGSMHAVRSFLSDTTQLPKWITGLKQQKLVKQVDAKTTLNHRLLKVPNLAKIEVVFAEREYRGGEDSLVIVGRTVDIPGAPLPKESNAVIQYLNFSYYLQSLSLTVTKAMLVINIRHSFPLPEEALKDIQTTESLYMHSISEKFQAWQRSDISPTISHAHGAVIAAFLNHQHWEKLAEENWVRGFRTFDCKTVVSIGEVGGGLQAVKAFLSDAGQFPRWVAGLQGQKVLAHYDAKTTFNHRLIQLPNLPTIEVAFVTREFAQSDGSVVLVSTTVPHLENAPRAKEGSVEIKYVNFSFHLRPVSAEKTQVMLVIEINHPFPLPPDALKQIQTGESTYVAQIAEKFSSWELSASSSVLSAGRSEVLEAWKSHTSWEKLAEEGPTVGYRSQDCKTVVSIGEIRGGIAAVTEFLLDGHELQKWVVGLKEQRLLTHLDAKTTLNQRFLRLPNLPEIEVVFATKEFREADGSVVLVSRTVAGLKDTPKPKVGNVAVEYLNFSFYLHKLEEEKTKVMFVININHPFQLPPEALKQIQTGESMYMKAINEKFAVKSLSMHTDATRVRVLDAVYNHTRWEQLFHEGELTGCRTTDCKTVVSVGEVEGSLPAVRAFLSDPSQFPRWVTGLKEHKVLSRLDHHTTLNHRLTQVPNLPEIEVVFVTRDYEEKDGSVVIASCSVPNFPGAPQAKAGNVEVEYVSYSYYLKALSYSKTQVLLAINIKHPFDLPPEVLKSIQTGESQYVRAINDAFKSWENADISVSLNEGHKEVLEAWNNHEKWEKLGETGHTQGFRSADRKTVVSVGVVEANKRTVRGFLLDGSKLGKWLLGLKGQKLVRHLDAKTTLNHRLIELPNLPGIEVVFATRAYYEEDGSISLVSRSVQSAEGAPEPKEGNVAVQYANFSFYLQDLSELRTKVMLVLNIRHPFQLPEDALKQIQTGESLYVHAIAEKVKSWLCPDISPALDSAHSELLSVLQAHEKWEKLGDAGTVRGFRSHDCRTVVSVGEVQGGLDAVKTFLADYTQLPRWVAGLSEQRVLAHYDCSTTLYRRVVNLPNLPEIEVVFFTREYREEDGGKVALVSTSVPHLTVPKPKEGNVEISYNNFSFHLKQLSVDTTQVTLVININHPFQLPPEALKQIQTGESLYVQQIAEKFATWDNELVSPALDQGRAEVLDAWTNLKSWEQLAIEDSTSGFRSPDHKTVVSVGQLPSDLNAVKTYLRDPAELAKWVAGLKQQRAVSHIDRRTTLNHRLIELPNLPGIEVLFATRTYEIDGNTVAIVSRSVPELKDLLSEKYGNVSVQYLNFSFYLKKESQNATTVMLVINIDHPFQLPEDALKAIQTNESLYVKVLAERFSKWTRGDIAPMLEIAKEEVLDAYNHCKSWEKLAEDGSLHGYRSHDWRTVLSIGEVSGDLCAVKSFLSSPAQYQRWVLGLTSQTVLSHIDAHTTLSHRTLQMPNLPGIEVSYVTREYCDEAGNALLVSRSIPHLAGTPTAKDGSVVIEYVNYSFYLRRLSGGVTEVALVINIKHPFQLPPDVLKQIQTGESLYVGQIAEKFATWERSDLNPHLDVGRTELLSAVSDHSSWEKLAEDGSTRGYRSSDFKTVFSIGEVPGTLLAVKTFLTDGNQLAKWIVGLKKQTKLAQLDGKTTLNHRLVELPNLPGIEVVFATREYTEGDGSVLLISRSVKELEEAPKAKEGNVAVHYLNFSFHLRSLSDSRTQVALAINIDHPFELPAEALKSIQTNESLYLQLISSQFQVWTNPEYSPLLDLAKSAVAAAWESHMQWEKLGEDGSVSGFRSSDCRTVVSVGEVAGSVEAVKAFLTNAQQLGKWIAGMQTQKTLARIDGKTVLNHRIVQLPNLPQIEATFALREYAEEDGSVFLISRTLPGYSPKAAEGSVQIEYQNFSFYLHKVAHDSTLVMLVIDIKHPFKLPPEALKGIQTRESLYVKAVAQTFASWKAENVTEELDTGRSDLLSAVSSHSSWEKLAEDGTTRGYRSSDFKTVFSIGEVPGTLLAVKTFLTDGNQLAKWIAGLKRQTKLAQLDGKTTLNHRLVELPNLPGIEVVFATREYTEGDGSVLLVSRSVKELEEAPKAKEGNVVVKYLNYSFHLRQVPNGSTEVALAINIDHPFQLPDEVLKGIQTGESMYVNVLKGQFQSWSESSVSSALEAARSEIIDSLQHHLAWEKLGGEGSVQGFRSADHRTVVSIGEVESPLSAIRQFLSSPDQLCRLVPGMQQQRTLVQLDSTTTLERRLSRVPNLPEIEVVFANRWHREGDGSELLIARSVPGLLGAPKPKPGNASVEFLNYSFYLHPISGTETQVMLVINIKHPFTLPPDALKAIQTNESLLVSALARLIAK